MDRTWSGETDTAEADAREALELGRRLGDRLTEFYAVMSEASIAHLQGWLTQAMDLSVDAGRIVTAVSADDEITHYEMPPVGHLINADRFEEAEMLLSSAPAWCEERGGAVQPMRHYQQMRSYLFRGAWDDAIVEGESALVLAQDSGTTWMTDSANALLALIAARRDELPRAESYLAQLDNGAVEDRDVEAVVARTQVAAMLGEHDRVVSILDSHRDVLLQPLGIHRLRNRSNLVAWRNWGALLMQLYLAVGDRKAATVLAERIEALAERAQVTSVRGLALLCHGILDDSATELLAAVEIFRGTPRTVDLATACEEAGAAAGSAVLLGEALDLYHRFGARHDAARTISRLRVLGVRPGQRGARSRPSTGWRSLTPTERQVAELVSDGLLYKEVASRLFVSRRTVETHVAHLFGKLSVASRVELSRVVREQIREQSQ